MVVPNSAGAMTAAGEEGQRDRSRSPRRTEGAAAAEAPKAAVPSHWMTPKTAAPAAGGSAPPGDGAPAAAPAPKGKGKGKASKARGSADVDSSDEVGPAALLSKAESLEEKDKEMAEFLRKAAAKMAVLEKSNAELGTAVRAIFGIADKAVDGMDGIQHMEARDVPMFNASIGDAKGEESFMTKKGDSELAEIHRKANEKPTMASIGGSGTMSAETQTREQMDAARKARLERLEASQADKKKEQDIAATKSRAREALAKPLLVTKRLGEL